MQLMRLIIDGKYSLLPKLSFKYQLYSYVIPKTHSITLQVTDYPKLSPPVLTKEA